MMPVKDGNFCLLGANRDSFRLGLLQRDGDDEAECCGGGRIEWDPMKGM